MKITLVPIPGTNELYAIPIRESASHDPLKPWDEIILKLHDRIAELETLLHDALDAATILHVALQDANRLNAELRDRDDR